MLENNIAQAPQVTSPLELVYAVAQQCVEGMHSPQFAHVHRTQHVITTRVRTLEHSSLFMYIFPIFTILVSRLVQSFLSSYCC